MAGALEQRARHLQEFSRHASHEFRTPIASIRGAVEVLQDHAQGMPVADRERFLGNIAADADRLHRLTQRLMELSKAELNTDVAKPFAVGPVVARVMAQAVPAGLEIILEGLTDLRNAKGSEPVRQAVLEILLENAVQQGARRFRVIGGLCDDLSRVCLQVQDDGAGISQGNREKIFEPFFTTQREHGGTGLGLSIARALLQQVDGDLRLGPDVHGEPPQRWTNFEIRCHTAGG